MPAWVSTVIWVGVAIAGVAFGVLVVMAISLMQAFGDLLDGLTLHALRRSDGKRRG